MHLACGVSQQPCSLSAAQQFLKLQHHLCMFRPGVHEKLLNDDCCQEYRSSCRVVLSAVLCRHVGWSCASISHCKYHPETLRLDEGLGSGGQRSTFATLKLTLHSLNVSIIFLPSAYALPSVQELDLDLLMACALHANNYFNSQPYVDMQFLDRLSPWSAPTTCLRLRYLGAMAR